MKLTSVKYAYDWLAKKNRFIPLCTYGRMFSYSLMIYWTTSSILFDNGKREEATVKQRQWMEAAADYPSPFCMTIAVLNF